MVGDVLWRAGRMEQLVMEVLWMKNVSVLRLAGGGVFFGWIKGVYNFGMKLD